MKIKLPARAQGVPISNPDEISSLDGKEWRESAPVSRQSRRRRPDVDSRTDSCLSPC
jgi:hypothetical protein